MTRKDEFVELLVRARKCITDLPGWDDDETTTDLLDEIDAAFGGQVPSEGRGAYDDSSNPAYLSDDE